MVTLHLSKEQIEAIRARADRIEREGCIRWANGELDDITALVALARKGLKPIPADDREEVARAICKSRTCEGINCCQWPSQTGRQKCPVKAGGYSDAADAAISTLVSLGWSRSETFQSRVKPWMLECFGPTIPFDKTERNHRFLEEALELVQSLGCTQSEAHQLVDYVFNRPAGEPPQESGGVMVTHAALCIANNLDMMQNAETELARIWTKVEVIRAKQAAKPKHSPLPGPSEDGGK